MFDFELSSFAVVAFVLIGLLLSLMILYTRAKLVSTAPVKIHINDNDELTKDVSAGQTLLSALSAEGLAIPSPCGGKATCKQCRVQVTAGGGDILETDIATFSPKELKAGWRLSCQCKVKTDMGLKLPESMLTLREIKAKVVSNDNVATFIKELVVEVEEPVEYIPGDYLQFHVPPYETNTSDWKATMDEQYYADWQHFGLFDRSIKYEGEEIIRAYSMASYPAEGRIYKFNIRIASPPFAGKDLMDVPWGLCSSYTFMLKPGDEIKLSGPFGESHMIDDERELVFLIGGAGSSFGRAHILDLFHTKKTNRKVTLWYGARSLKENIYQEEYEKLAIDASNFSYNLVLSAPTEEDIKSGWPTDDPLKTAFLFKAFEEGQLKGMEEPENAIYYVCGPPMHNSSIMTLLDNYGVPSSSVILDDFGS
ncbi:MAG: Na(+)-translocating NADH-quinone reductase subunit F [Chlamydiia bacterium]|nr:Na(+)-translocating NADH-quinone reductase subunit F [Chlamydiia bacterium]MCH9614956.1 Na(+)-translocating NADH-quinone reductase subunit F [Chlamydiia bacterium]MCH9629994.1 Na(+)-translocating NADH-quinone reductase subunit F [Chlamydiia bacterium]